MRITLWKPEPDVLIHQALGKACEEATELAGILARCLIQGLEASEPATGKPNRHALSDEIADLDAAVQWLRELIGDQYDEERADRKLNGFRRWQRMLEDDMAAFQTPAPSHVEPVAWLRPGEYVPIQNCPFGAMWISDKDDPRAFPVYAKPPQVVHQEPIGYISRQTFAELVHDNSGSYDITTPNDLMGDDLVPIFTLPGAHPSVPESAEQEGSDADQS